MFNFASKVADEPAVASVVLTGVAIVFGMLLLFVIIFSLFGVFNKVSKQTDKTEKKTAPVKQSIKATTVMPTPSTEDEDIIAVIAAAVYSMYEGTGKKAVIRSIKPASSTGRSAWATAGLYNNIKSF